MQPVHQLHGGDHGAEAVCYTGFCWRGCGKQCRGRQAGLRAGAAASAVGVQRDAGSVRLLRTIVDASALPPGRYWVGLEVEGRDGSVEHFAGEAVELRHPDGGATATR